MAKQRPLVATAFFLSLISCAFLDGGKSLADGKSEYHLFNRTPDEKMRGFITDRPDRTESPITVDAGHFQIETDLLNFTQYEENRSLVLNWMNLKVGVTNNSDLQLILPSLVKKQDRVGVGNLTLRYKVNFFGNDDGSTAFGVMPYVTLPTQSSFFGRSRVEGGVTIPYSFSAPAGFSMGAMMQYDWIRNSNDNGFHPQFISSFVVSRDLIQDLEGYLEFFSQTEAETDWVATVDLGLILSLTDSLRLDMGSNIGVTQEAEDVTGFLGLSFRL